jgi:hypothetical protein
MNGWCANLFDRTATWEWGRSKENGGNLEIEKLRFGSTGAQGDH